MAIGDTAALFKESSASVLVSVGHEDDKKLATCLGITRLRVPTF
jgi:hypothetical protein